MAESFFSIRKNERVYRTVYATKAQGRKDLIQYIEGSTTIDAGTPRSASDAPTEFTMGITSRPWQRRRIH